MKNNISFLLKPVSSDCQLSCRYCFYNPDLDDGQRTRKRMKWATVLALIEKGLAFAAGGRLTLAFQGGEPTLAGIDFYRRLTAAVERLNRNGTTVTYAIQSNGQLLNKGWAEFFYRNNFLVGLSLDGPSVIHDQNRRAADNKGSHESALTAARLLQRYRVNFNVLSVVTSAVFGREAELYRYFHNLGVGYLQFIPCLEPMPAAIPRSTDTISFLTTTEYEKFLITMFDLWRRDLMAGQPLSIRYFDNLLAMFLGHEPEACDMRGVCSMQHVVETDGSVYPCDFYVERRYRLGNINDDRLIDIHESRLLRDFVNQSAQQLKKFCVDCRWFALCRGGCRRQRLPDDRNIVINRFCAAYQQFFNYAHRPLREIAAAYRRKETR